MTKRFTSFTLAAALSILPAAAFAKTLTGRVTNFSPTSISVFDKEVVTVGLNGETVFTKLLTQKPWQESDTLSFSAISPNRMAEISSRRNPRTRRVASTPVIFFIMKRRALRTGPLKPSGMKV